MVAMRGGDGDHIRAAVLTYSDVQKYFKRLRKTVGKFKYLVAGEYGEEKGRAHWHAILFTDKPIEHIEFDKNIMEKHWGHGWSYYRRFRAEHGYYCCKYVFKNIRG